MFISRAVANLILFSESSDVLATDGQIILKYANPALTNKDRKNVGLGYTITLKISLKYWLQAERMILWARSVFPSQLSVTSTNSSDIYTYKTRVR